jgi:hypothetical protein
VFEHFFLKVRADHTRPFSPLRRSTVIPRDLFIERLLRRDWSYNFSEGTRAELARMVSVGVLTEIALDNASAFISPFMLYRMFKEPIFMANVPNRFFDAGGHLPFTQVRFHWWPTFLRLRNAIDDDEFYNPLSGGHHQFQSCRRTKMK